MADFVADLGGEQAISRAELEMVRRCAGLAVLAAQHEAAREAFDELADERFLPFDQINEDHARAELDRRLIVDVLGLSPNLCDVGGPMERLRAKLAAEPQIHSDKRTRVVFTATGETNDVR